MLDQAVVFWERLEANELHRVHLATLPMADPEKNAIIVNALQRRAAVINEKTVAEGFGLTAAEAIWRAAQWWRRGSAGSRPRSSTTRPVR